MQLSTAFLDRLHSFSFGLRTWNANSPGTLNLIASSPSTAFQIVFSDPGVNGSSEVVFSADGPSFNDLLATPNAAKNPPYNELEMSVPLRPLIADNGTVVVREGNTNTSPIVLLDNTLDSATAVTVASTVVFNSHLFATDDVLLRRPGDDSIRLSSRRNSGRGRTHQN